MRCGVLSGVAKTRGRAVRALSNGLGVWISPPATGWSLITASSDLIYTHITARVPGAGERFLINPYGWRWDEITASSLVEIDVDGNKVDASDARVNPAGFTIHSAVHMAREDAVCVLHTHTKAGMAVSALEGGLLPISQIALQWFGRHRLSRL